MIISFHGLDISVKANLFVSLSIASLFKETERLPSLNGPIQDNSSAKPFRSHSSTMFLRLCVEFDPISASLEINESSSVASSTEKISFTAWLETVSTSSHAPVENVTASFVEPGSNQPVSYLETVLSLQVPCVSLFLMKSDVRLFELGQQGFQK